MAKTVTGILAQIEKLKSRLATEQNKAIPRIRREIANLGLTVEHLFGKVEAALSAPSTPTAKAAKVSKASSKPASTVRFADGKGGTWSGHGKRPNWYIKALETQSKEQLEALGSKHAGLSTAAPAATTVSATTTTIAPAKKTRSEPVKKVATVKAKVTPVKVASETAAKAPSKVVAKSPVKTTTKPVVKAKTTAKAKPAAVAAGTPVAATANEAPATKQ